MSVPFGVGQDPLWVMIEVSAEPHVDNLSRW